MMACLRNMMVLVAMGCLWLTLATPQASAQAIWTGDGSVDDWSDGDNWDGGIAPTAGDELHFDGDTRTEPNNDLAAGTNFAGILFLTDADAFTLGGNNLEIDADGVLQNLSTELQTLSLSIAALGDMTIDADAGDLHLEGGLSVADTFTLTVLGDADTQISGVISGDGGLTLDGPGMLTLTQANTFAGGTTLNGGHLRIEDAEALGTGDVAVTGDSSFGASDELAAPVANNFSIDNDVTLTLGGSEDMTLDGLIDGDGGLLVNTDDAENEITLTNTNNAYAGGTVVQRGTLVSNNNALTDDGRVDLVGGEDASLVIGHDETIGSLAGTTGSTVDLGDNTLTLGGDDTDSIFAGSITGNDGSLVVTGTGTLTLTQGSTYTGGTTLEDGHLRLQGAANLGTGDLTVTGDASLGATEGGSAVVGNDITINNGITLTLSGVSDIVLNGSLKGEGDILKSGESTVTLSGPRSDSHESVDTPYTGTIRIEEGILTLATRVGGDVELADGELRITTANPIPDGVLTISGGQITAWNDTRTLENHVRIDGDFVVAGGNFFTLDIDDAAELRGNHTITTNAQTQLAIATLVADQAGRVLTKDGAGQLRINAAPGFNGQLNIDDGFVELADGEMDVDFVVNDGGWLTGWENGGVEITGDVLVNSGGTHLPTGTETVEGNYRIATGGRLRIGYDAGDSLVDNVDVIGPAVFEQDSVVDIVSLGQAPLRKGESFTVLTASDGITDEGAIFIPYSAFLGWSGEVVGNAYVLTLEQIAFFENIAQTRNNRSIARSLDNLATSDMNEDQQFLINEIQSLDAVAFNRTMRHLSPEQGQALPSSTIQVAHAMQGTFSSRMAQQRLGIVAAPANNTGSAGLTLASAELSPAVLAQVIGSVDQPWVNPRLQQAQPRTPIRERYPDFFGEWNFDIQGFGLYQRQDSTSRQLGYRARTGGFVASADRTLTPHWRVGLTFSYAHTDLNFHDRRGDGDINHLRGGPYASYARDQWYVDGSITLGHHRNSVNRRIQIGEAELTAEGDFNSHDVAVFIGGGYDFDINPRTKVTPFGSLDYLHYNQRGYTESGAGPADLTVDSSSDNSLRSTLGVRLMHIFPMGATTIVPEVSAAWRHEFLFDEYETTASFVNTDTPFTIRNRTGSRDTAVLGAGASALVTEDIAAYANYEAQIGGDDSSHMFNIGAQFRF